MGSQRMALAELIEVEEVPEKRASGGSKRLATQKRERAQSTPRKLSRRKIEELILAHREHGKRLAWSFLSSWRIRMNQDEVMSVVGMALCEAANRFDADKGVSFKTFFFYHLRGMLLKEISKVIQEQRVLQFVPHSVGSSYASEEQFYLSKGAFSLVENNNPERIIQKRQIASICWGACAQLDALEQEVVIRYFIYDEPLIKIAQDLDYCRCHISRVKSRALAKLGKILRSNNDEAMVSETRGRVLRIPTEVRRTHNYTGGRGRRRQRGSVKKSETLQKILEQSY